jgi:drug/metabolite transporter (DMT)-like permease
MNRKALIFYFLCIIWGSTWLFIKLGLRDLPPISFAGIRFLIASIVLVSIVKVRKIELPRASGDWLLIFFTGILTFSLNYGLVFWGEQRTSSGLASILHAIIPLFGLVLAHYYIPEERFSWAKAGCVLLGIAGVGIIFSNQLSSEGSSVLIGSIALVTGAFSISYSSVLIKARSRHIDPVVLAAGQMTFGFVPLLVIGWAVEGSPFTFHWTGQAVVSLLYLAIVGSCCAFLMYYWLLRRMQVTTTMLISLVTPAVAVLLGLWYLAEPITWQIIVGALCIMIGISINIYRSRASKEEIQPEPVEEFEG